MPGAGLGLPWPRNNNKDSSSNSNNQGGFRRKRRSLLGRKNRSENDLAQQSTLPQQQRQQPRLAALPDNVKTILVAGTPEVWSLSNNINEMASITPAVTRTSQDVVSSSNEVSDASVLSDEWTPCTVTTSSCAFDETPSSTSESRPSRHGSLDWWPVSSAHQRSKAKSAPDRDARNSQKKQQPAPEQPKEPTSMIVMYKSPSPPPPWQALHIWCKLINLVATGRGSVAETLQSKLQYYDGQL
jgi:hypothetical protein